MRTRLLLLLAGIAAGPLLASVVSADEPPRLDDLKFDAGRSSMSAERAGMDSDGDGWVDWYERFEGTDPFDASSYPGSATLEIVDDRVVLQSVAFPDRLVIVDLATPDVLHKPETALDALVGLVQGLKKGAGPGSALNDMIRQFGKYGGILPDVAAIIAQNEKDTGVSFDLGPRVGGQPMSLISDIEVGENSSKQTTITYFHRDGKNETIVIVTPAEKKVEVGTVEYYGSSSGAAVEVATGYTNGRRTGFTLFYYDSKGNPTWYQRYDGKGVPIGGPVSATGTPAGATESSVPPPSSAAGGTGSTVPASSTPGNSTPSSVTPTTEGDYADPQYDRPQLPSAAEIAARAEFLKGISARFGSTVDLPDRPADKPGVVDPAEPECRGAFCVVFTVVEAPDLRKTAGGDPINPLYGPLGPPITIS
ncbi:MAG: hypothetical protein WCC60_08735 [Ilumatobacteraceae bacterium]